MKIQKRGCLKSAICHIERSRNVGQNERNGLRLPAYRQAGAQADTRAINETASYYFKGSTSHPRKRRSGISL